MDGDLSVPAFEEKLGELILAAELDWIVEAPTPDNDGMRPVGLILAHACKDGRRIEPHIDWFPWASPRNKFEGIAAFLREVSRQYKILIYVEADQSKFWERLKNYRILVRGCRILDHYSRGEHAMFYYTVGP